MPGTRSAARVERGLDDQRARSCRSRRRCRVIVAPNVLPGIRDRGEPRRSGPSGPRDRLLGHRQLDAQRIVVDEREQRACPARPTRPATRLRSATIPSNGARTMPSDTDFDIISTRACGGGHLTGAPSRTAVLCRSYSYCGDRALVEQRLACAAHSCSASCFCACACATFACASRARQRGAADVELDDRLAHLHALAALDAARR